MTSPTHAVLYGGPDDNAPQELHRYFDLLREASRYQSFMQQASVMLELLWCFQASVKKHWGTTSDITTVRHFLLTALALQLMRDMMMSETPSRAFLLP